MKLCFINNQSKITSYTSKSLAPANIVRNNVRYKLETQHEKIYSRLEKVIRIIALIIVEIFTLGIYVFTPSGIESVRCLVQGKKSYAIYISEDFDKNKARITRFAATKIKNNNKKPVNQASSQVNFLDPNTSATKLYNLPPELIALFALKLPTTKLYQFLTEVIDSFSVLNNNLSFGFFQKNQNSKNKITKRRSRFFPLIC